MIICKICSEKHILNAPQRSMLQGWGEVDVKCPTIGLTARYKRDEPTPRTPKVVKAVAPPKSASKRAKAAHAH
jgi:hypothetical protein